MWPARRRLVAREEKVILLIAGNSGYTDAESTLPRAARSRRREAANISPAEACLESHSSCSKWSSQENTRIFSAILLGNGVRASRTCLRRRSVDSGAARGASPAAGIRRGYRENGRGSLALHRIGHVSGGVARHDDREA